MYTTQSHSPAITLEQVLSRRITDKSEPKRHEPVITVGGRPFGKAAPLAARTQIYINLLTISRTFTVRLLPPRLAAESVAR